MLTAALFTMDAAPHLAEIHDRNPLMLPEDFWSDWLDTGAAGYQELVNAAIAVSEPFAQEVEFYPVRKFSTKDDGPELTTPAS